MHRLRLRAQEGAGTYSTGDSGKELRDELRVRRSEQTHASLHHHLAELLIFGDLYGEHTRETDTDTKGSMAGLRTVPL